jgi:transposase
MDGIERIKDDIRKGRIDPERLAELLATLQRQMQAATSELEAAKRELEAAKRRIAELEKQVGRSATTKVDEPFSMRAEEQRQEARGKLPRQKKQPVRRGRLTTAEKIKRAVRTEQVFPAGVAESDCQYSHTRVIWRLENGQAVLVAYDVYRGPKNLYGKIPGALGRSEFGIEIIVTIAHLIFVVGLSFDKVCTLLKFFQNLELRKSQADALMNRLSRHWAGEFERLCTLLANSAVVHTDETSWSIHSVWAFLSEKARVVFFGVHKDAETLRAILDPATFAGIVISDDAAVYANFTHSQKCWAHLLRKAIKLTLQEPTNAKFREFTDRLLEIYRMACRVQRDQRFSDAGRAKKVAELDRAIIDLCAATWIAELPKGEGPDDDYRLLCEELMRLMWEQQLFTFVTAAPVTTPQGTTQPVAGTNNEAERTLRGPAMARDTGRTNKAPAGTRRQTIIVSVLESLRNHLPTFTLAGIIEEVTQWCRTGQSCFARLVDTLGLSLPEKPILDRVIPRPSG